MIIGEYQSKIGDKKRIALPKKMRDEIGNQLILTRGYENCLVLVNRKMWETVASEVMNGSFINSNIRETSRFLVGSAIEVEPDIQGRFVIPQALFEHGKFNEDIVFIGLVNWIEIWDKTQWDKKLKQLQLKSSEIADEISKMNNSK
ncbi:division/cell wall cluster transcriptional repressor MraZ [Candidatus Dojkabacteria bacterium]|jgi:MraZ protein|nr:division/cell wall cluster transcriptional repressor MraZ [Candidatus Dojkabacteria bacterium]